MLSAKTMDWHFLPSQLFQRQLVRPWVAGRGDGGDGDWAKAKDFAVLDHAIDLGPKGHNDVILRILAAPPCRSQAPKSPLHARSGRAGRRLDRRNAADMVDMLMTGEQELGRPWGQSQASGYWRDRRRGFGGRSVDQNMAFVRRDQDHADPAGCRHNKCCQMRAGSDQPSRPAHAAANALPLWSAVATGAGQCWARSWRGPGRVGEGPNGHSWLHWRRARRRSCLPALQVRKI